MKPPGWLAALVLFLHLPIPLYWLVVHPWGSFWRSRPKAAYIAGVLCSWLPVTAALVVFRHRLFRSDWPPVASLLTAVGLITFEGWIFWRVHHDLGTARLVGKTELSGSGELEIRGIYARIRHPRYTGSFLAIVGACLLAGTAVMWMIAACWLILMRFAIALEESELRRRFGARYEAYARAVPRFFPVRATPRMK